jgi:L-amino acid N-acyltransferase YncA
MKTRDAAAADASAIARIYNEGIDDRVATFETRHRTADDVVRWFDARHPAVVVEEDDGEVIAFAATSTYRPRDCYAGIAEFSVYALRAARGRGAGRMAMEALFAAARAAGFWKLVSRVFVENVASRGLLRVLGFREVGVYERHGQLDGVWRDVVIVEKLVGEHGRVGNYNFRSLP